MGMRLGGFARYSLERHCGGDAGAAVGHALSLYRRRLDAGEALPPPPAFLPDGGGEPFDLDVEADVAAALMCDARERLIPVELLLRHAVLVYLSEIDRGAASPSG